MEDYFRKIFIIKNGWRLEIIQLELNSEWMKDNSFENCVARGYAKSSRLEMTRFPRNVSPRPRVRLFPRGHLRRLSPEKRLCNNAREKRSAPLLYTLLANNSPYPSFFHSPYVHLFPFFRDGIYRVWKYFFTRISFRFSLHVRIYLSTSNENYEIIFTSRERFVSLIEICKGKRKAANSIIFI